MNLYLLETVRTNNFTDPEMVSKITGLWQSLQTLEPPLEGNVYGVYSDYESDYKGDYSFAIATTEPRSQMSIPIFAGMNYTKFAVETDVAATWAFIWDLEESGELHRAYTVDFESYQPDGSVVIYIAIQ
ncbi:hypothetical protein G7062_05465 [Erysipelothrix sp. HDW6C]|uniref:effector binding domain-containing protein n=1 Tax=Erysipelothrix sp. HDW6C TaxID=2714930 RepID=UPI00140C4F53|nr:effector binding domain-containing protein [Erysipelothrix sp. HDW6C]QIK69778.1 hypothetical protein G7062_05465 [Erysipelothrix sp. HDW6C]